MAASDLHVGTHCTCATDSLGGTTIGKVHNFTLQIARDTQPHHSAGSEDADAISTGNKTISGSLTLAFVDKTQLLDLADASPIAEDDLYVQLADGVTDNETVDITLADVKYDNWSFGFDNTGATIEESAVFFAKTITVGETTQ